MVITIQDGAYFIPESFKDITLKQFVKINNFVESRKLSDEAVESEKFEYYIDFVCLFDIDKDILKKVKLYDEDDKEWGLINLFNHLYQFTQMPDKDTIEKFDGFYFKGMNFKFNRNSLSLTGAEKPMVDYTFEEYEEANSILMAMSQVGEGKLEHLSLLCAIFFRPTKWKRFKRIIEPYNSDSVRKRADLFMELDMQRVFAAYFFLLNQIFGYNLDTADYLLKEMESTLI